MHPARRFGAGWRWGGNHQTKTLQKQDGALRRASPDKLATFALAILHVNIPAGILQAAILEFAIYIDTFVQNHVLILEDLVLIPIHRFTRAACRRKESYAFRRRNRGRGSREVAHPLEAPR